MDRQNFIEIRENLKEDEKNKYLRENEPKHVVQKKTFYKNTDKNYTTQYISCRRENCINFKKRKCCLAVRHYPNKNVFSIYVSVNHVEDNNVSDTNASAATSAACSTALTNNMQESNIYTEEANQFYDDLMLEELVIDTLSQIKVKTIDDQETCMITGIYYKIQKKADDRFIYGFKCDKTIEQRKEEEINDKDDKENILWTLIGEEGAMDADKRRKNYYRIKKKRGNRVIDGITSDREIMQQPDDILSHDNRLWQLVACEKDRRYFRLKKKGDGRVIDGWEDITLINQQSDDEDYHTHRLWRFVPDCKLHATVTDFEYSKFVFKSLLNDCLIRERVFDNATDQMTENEMAFETHDTISFKWRFSDTNEAVFGLSSEQFKINVLLAPPDAIKGLGFTPGFKFAFGDEERIRSTYERSHDYKVNEKTAFKVAPRTRKRVQIMYNDMVSTTSTFRAKIQFNVKADRLRSNGSITKDSDLDPVLAKYLLEKNGYFKGSLLIDGEKLYSEIEGSFDVKYTQTFTKLEEFQLPMPTLTIDNYNYNIQ